MATVTKLTIAKLGLGRIASSVLSSIDTPRSVLERRIADGYDVWRDSELKKHDWVFAKASAVLTVTLPARTLSPRPYRFELPVDFLRPLRTKRARWEIEGTALYDVQQDDFRLDYIARKPENEFPPDFQQVLGARIAIECAEIATQSASKLQLAMDGYDYFTNEARRNNAFTIEPPDNTLDDENSSWVYGRYNHGGL